MDRSKKLASKETLSKLMDNTSYLIRDLYSCLKTEIQVLEHMKDSDTKQIRILCQQMSIAVNYSLMDIGVSLRASIGSEKAYEKRFHLKNLKASISESYKLILNFGKARNKSIWNKLGAELKGTNHLVEEIYIRITAALDDFADSHINQDLRNLTLHYDEDMMRVYEATVSIND